MVGGFEEDGLFVFDGTAVFVIFFPLSDVLEGLFVAEINRYSPAHICVHRFNCQPLYMGLNAELGNYLSDEIGLLLSRSFLGGAFWLLGL